MVLQTFCGEENSKSLNTWKWKFSFSWAAVIENEYDYIFDDGIEIYLTGIFFISSLPKHNYFLNILIQKPFKKF